MLTRIVHANRPTQVGAASPNLPGDETRRVPVIVIRTGDAAERQGTERPGALDDRDRISIAGNDYRLTLSSEAIARDREVRGHERAHMAALGGYAASGINYTTRTGPEGETVAVGGRIAVDLAEVPGDPRGTLHKARTIYQAATAPGDPSAADMRVAAQAYRLMQKAQDDIAAEKSRIDESA